MAAATDPLQALRDKAAAARAAREAAQLAKETEPEEVRLTREIEDETAIAAAIEAHGAIGEKIALIRTRMGVVIVRRPDKPVWRRFSDGKETTGKEGRGLVIPSLVHPTAARFDEIEREYPAVLEQAVTLVTDLAVARDKEATGK